MGRVAGRLLCRQSERLQRCTRLFRGRLAVATQPVWRPVGGWHTVHRRVVLQRRRVRQGKGDRGVEAGHAAGAPLHTARPTPLPPPPPRAHLMHTGTHSGTHEGHAADYAPPRRPLWRRAGRGTGTRGCTHTSMPQTHKGRAGARTPGERDKGGEGGPGGPVRLRTSGGSKSGPGHCVRNPRERGGGGVGLVWISACAKGGDPRPVCPYLTGSTGYPPWLSGLTAVQTADDPRTSSRR